MLITLDFETYFEGKYSLRNMPTQAYVRDPRFKALGAAIKVNEDVTKFYRGQDLESFIRNLDGSEELLCHNTAFDGLILSFHYNYVPKRYYDTLSMSRPLLGHTTDLDLDSLMKHVLGTSKEVDILELEGVKEPTGEQLLLLRQRAIDDVDGTYGVFQHLLEDFPEEELEVIDTTIRMFANPRFVLDRNTTASIVEEENNRRETLLEKLGLTATDVRSPNKFAALLEKAGATVPMKPSPTHPEVQTYAFARTDSGLQALRNHECEEVRDLVEARLVTKANQLVKRAERLLEVTEHSPEWRLSIPLKYCGAHTFRYAGFDYINPQNFGRGSPIRSCLKADDDHLLDIKDYAQIEARIVAWLAGQEDLVAAFADPNRDPYCEFATELFGFEVTKESHPEHRFIAKQIILGSGYGMGFIKLIATIKNLSIVELGEEMVISEAEAQKYIYFYRDRYQKISSRKGTKGLWGKMHYALEHMIYGHGTYEVGPLKFQRGKVLMPNGLHILYNGLRGYGDPEYEKMGDFSYLSKDFRNARIDIYDGKLTENMVQSLARIIMTQGMNRVKDRFQVLLQVHDEIICEIPKIDAQAASDWITEQLVIEPEWAPGLPLEVEGGYSQGYSK